MGLTKTEIFSETEQAGHDDESAGHPARIAIIQHVIKNKFISGDLVEELGLAQPTISQHLKELKKGLTGTIEGTSVCYCIDQKSGNNLKRSSIPFS
jgi:hypothetical protein